MIYYQLKILMKNKTRRIILSIGFLAYLIYATFFFCVGDFSFGGNFIFYRMTLVLFFFFVLILIVSFQYFFELEGFETDFKDYSKKYSLVKYLVLLMIPVIFCIFFVMVCCLSLFIADEICWQIVKEIIKVAFLYIFINSVLAIFASRLIAYIKYKMVGYLFVILVSMIFSPMLSVQIEANAIIGNFIYDKVKPFIIFLEAFGGWNDFVQIPINIAIVSRSLFWIFIALFLVFMIKRKWIKGIISSVFYVMFFFLMYIPESYFLENGSSINSDAAFYNPTYYKNAEQKEAKGVKVNGYKMTLLLRENLEAEVIVYIDQSESTDDYIFTLYHLYKISEIKDENGNNLIFEREGDYIKVITEEKKNELRFYYKGGGACFYSNYESSFLPGYFAYYPISGYHKIYDIDNFSFCDCTNDYDVECTALLESESDVYSNLNTTNLNEFKGCCRYPTFISGFIKEKNIDENLTIYYPYLSEALKTNTQLSMESYEFDVKTIKESGYNKLFFVPILLNQSREFEDGNSLFIKNNWYGMSRVYKYNGTFISDEHTVMKTYDEMKKYYAEQLQMIKNNQSGIVSYETAKQLYIECFENFYYHEHGTTVIPDEVIDEGIKNIIGIEEYNSIRGD